MSSDSDDIDEDELLQIALKEQAQRDLNYRKSQPSRQSKPVANYLQPPPPPPSQFAKDQRTSVRKIASSTPPQVHKQSRRVLDDDDESEVELLSISSGDEDSSKDRSFSSKNLVGRGGAAVGGDDVGNRGWDGDEPDCWKRVDEAEVCAT